MYPNTSHGEDTTVLSNLSIEVFILAAILIRVKYFSSNYPQILIEISVHNFIIESPHLEKVYY